MEDAKYHTTALVSNRNRNRIQSQSRSFLNKADITHHQLLQSQESNATSTNKNDNKLIEKNKYDVKREIKSKNALMRRSLGVSLDNTAVMSKGANSIITTAVKTTQSKNYQAMSLSMSRKITSQTNSIIKLNSRAIEKSAVLNQINLTKVEVGNSSDVEFGSFDNRKK